MMKNITFEVCVDTLEGAMIAINNGADRVELCSALALGGLTPSAGLMKAASKLQKPIYAMIRPRGGDFIFNFEEMDIMLHEIDRCREYELAGIVIGITHKNGALDYNKLRSLVDHADGLGVTLHRAFDVTPDPMEALEMAIDLKIERILTSGQKETAIEGAQMIGRVMESAKKRISIMPCSNINPCTVKSLLEIIDFSEIHSSCKSKLISPYEESAPSMAEGDDFTRTETDAKKVKALADYLKSLTI